MTDCSLFRPRSRDSSLDLSGEDERKGSESVLERKERKERDSPASVREVHRLEQVSSSTDLREPTHDEKWSQIFDSVVVELDLSKVTKALEFWRKEERDRVSFDEGERRRAKESTYDGRRRAGCY